MHSDNTHILHFCVCLLSLIVLSQLVNLPIYASGDIQEPTVEVLLDKLPIEFPVKPFIDNDTTMVPLRALSEALGFEVVWDDATSGITCIKDDISISLQLENDTAKVNEIEHIFDTAPYRVGDHTVVPLRFFSECLGYQVQWDGETRTVYVKSDKEPLEIWGFYALGSGRYSSWEDMFADKYPYVQEKGAPNESMEGAFLGWFAVNEDGSLSSSGHPSGFVKPDGWPAVLMQLKLEESKAIAMIFAEEQGGWLSSLLADEARRKSLASDICSKTWEYDGILIDFEGLLLGDKDSGNFNLFLDEIRSQDDRFLSVAVPPLNGHYTSYDHTHIGKVADRIVLMAYGYEDPKIPTSTAPWSKVEEAIRLEVAQVPREKILLGVPAYGTLYKFDEGSWKLVSRPTAKDPLPESVTGKFVPRESCEFASWKDADTEYAIYRETTESLSARSLLAKRHGLGGIALWRLGILPNGWWEAIEESVEFTE